MDLKFITEVAKAPPRTPHPEDAIFDGSHASKTMMQAMEYAIEHPEIITIKWDGMPALVFGRNADGKLIIADKYMFDKPYGRVTSPQAWVDYDTQYRRDGANRGDLYKKIENIWQGVDEAVGNSPGYFWGDLLWSNVLEPVDGLFVFKPNVVEYRVDSTSKIGKLIKDRNGGIAVHSYLIDEIGMPQPWNGQGLKVDGNVTIITPNAFTKFKLNDPIQSHSAASNAIEKYCIIADEFIGGLDGVAKNAIRKYTNHKITGQTTEQLGPWLANNVSGKQYKKLVGDNGYLSTNKHGLAALITIWDAVYAFKVDLANQLERQIQGLHQSVNGQPGGEGFVFTTSNGPVKLVNRNIFSQALFKK